MKRQLNSHVHHQECFACQGTDGYYSTTPQHDDCTGKCHGPSEYEAPGECSAPCPCKCHESLTKNEIMDMRALIDHFGKLLR